MIRDANAAADRGAMKQDDAAPLLKTLDAFDAIFAVMKDDDAEKVKKTIEWAQSEGLADRISPEAREIAATINTSDEQIDAMVKEMQNARKTKNFAKADAIRNELNQIGIIVEVTKDGARWRRK
jgi:cysteinyl-tRNA synthetase